MPFVSVVPVIVPVAIILPVTFIVGVVISTFVVETITAFFVEMFTFSANISISSFVLNFKYILFV